MSELLIKHSTFLHMLEISTVRQRKALLEHASHEQITSLLTLTFNILKGIIPLTDGDKNRLSRHKSCIRSLATKTVSKHRKRQLLIDHQTILPICVKAYHTYTSWKEPEVNSHYHEQANGSCVKGDLSKVSGQSTVSESESDSDTDFESASEISTESSSQTGGESSDTE